LASRGLSIPKTFLWFYDCGLFESVRLVKDRRKEARADFELGLSEKAIEICKRVAKPMPQNTLTDAEDALRAAIDRERMHREQAGKPPISPAEVKVLREAQRLHELEEELRIGPFRKAIANISKGPRPKLVEIDFIDQDEIYVVVELPRQAHPGRPKLGSERFRGYAPEGTANALAQSAVKKFFPRQFPADMGRERAIELCTIEIESPEHGESAGFSPRLKEYLMQMSMIYSSEPVRLVPRKHKRMLLDVAAWFLKDGLGMAEIAVRLNEKGYTSEQGKKFSPALAEHVVIQSLSILGTWGPE
jgi:hypothetical protein